MYTLRRGGLALVASAAILALLILLTLFRVALPAQIFLLVLLLQLALLLAGLPAIYAMLPGTGRLGQIGILTTASGTALTFLLYFLVLVGVSSFPGVVVLLADIASSLGYVVVGWVTARARVFPSWVGWVLLAAGLVSVLLGPGGDGFILLGVALAGYGVTIVRITQPSVASEAE